MQLLLAKFILKRLFHLTDLKSFCPKKLKRIVSFDWLLQYRFLSLAVTLLEGSFDWLSFCCAELLKLATKERPLLIFLDSVDELTGSQA
jgi:hypothetical protein